MKKFKRPWGYYENLVESDGYKIKRLVVNPFSRLSLQKHKHRNEIWTVVEGHGIAEVTKKDGKKFEFIFFKSDVVAIKRNEKHRLVNNGNKRLVVIEVQTGSYLGEDDIIRYEDDYGRKA